MRVRVDEAWQQRAAVEVDNVSRARLDVRPDGADLPVGDKDVSPSFRKPVPSKTEPPVKRMLLLIVPT